MARWWCAPLHVPSGDRALREQPAAWIDRARASVGVVAEAHLSRTPRAREPSAGLTIPRRWRGMQNGWGSADRDDYRRATRFGSLQCEKQAVLFLASDGLSGRRD